MKSKAKGKGKVDELLQPISPPMQLHTHLQLQASVKFQSLSDSIEEEVAAMTCHLEREAAAIDDQADRVRIQNHLRELRGMFRSVKFARLVRAMEAGHGR